MDGGYVMEVEVYKERGEHWKKNFKKNNRRKNIERRK